jgi:carboxylesterase
MMSLGRRRRIEVVVPILPGAEPYAADGGPIGVVVCHGFTGNPASMRPWAEHLAKSGYSVRLPRLPGHGTTWQEMNATGWRDWYGEIDRAYQELTQHCDQIFACGLSMGGTLALRLAEEHSSAIAGLVLVNPSLAIERFDAKFAWFLAPILRSRPGIGSDIKKPGAVESSYDRTPLKAFVSLQQLWRVTVADLPRISAPILMFRSRVDHVVEPLSGRLLVERATATTVLEVILEDSYHVATLDNDAQLIFEGSVRFLEEHAVDRGGAGASEHRRRLGDEVGAPAKSWQRFRGVH